MGAKSFLGDCDASYPVIEHMHRPEQAEAF